MPRIIKKSNCGNSPKNLLVQSLTIAIETRNVSLFSRCVTGDVLWAMPGRKSLHGKATCLAYLKLRKTDVADQVLVRRITSHGRSGAGEGAAAWKGALTNGFCHVVDFSSAKGDKISRIISYYSDVGEEE